MISPLALVINLIYMASAIWLTEGLLMVANSLSSKTNPTIVPTKPNKGAIRDITERIDRFFSILYISSLPTLSMLFSIASIGFPIRWIPLSIILATGLSVFFARLLAAVTLPVMI